MLNPSRYVDKVHLYGYMRACLCVCSCGVYRFEVVHIRRILKIANHLTEAFRPKLEVWTYNKLAVMMSWIDIRYSLECVCAYPYKHNTKQGMITSIVDGCSNSFRAEM